MRHRGKNGIRLSSIAFMTLFLTALSICTAHAEVTVSDPVVDSDTQGDWLNIYGKCFYLLPDASTPETEIPTGPDFYSAQPNEYDNNNCFGGLLFDEGKIDWRIYRKLPTEDAFAFTLGAGEFFAAKPEGEQWNPCKDEFKGATWDNEISSYDPLALELKVNFEGSLDITYYFLDAANVCRFETINLYVNNELKSSQPLQVGDFSGGKYVTYHLSGLTGQTLVRVEATLVNESDATGCTIDGTNVIFYGRNSQISGVFIDKCEKPCIDIKKQVRKLETCSWPCWYQWCYKNNPWLDADTKDAALKTKDGVEYRFIVTNCGDTDLDDAKITDSELGLDNVSIGPLVAGEQVVITKATPGFGCLKQLDLCEDQSCYKKVCTDKQVCCWKPVWTWCGCKYQYVCETKQCCEWKRVDCVFENVVTVTAQADGTDVSDSDSAFVICPADQCSSDNNWGFGCGSCGSYTGGCNYNNWGFGGSCGSYTGGCNYNNNWSFGGCSH